MAKVDIKSVGDLKKYLADLPDDLPVYFWNEMVGRKVMVKVAQVSPVRDLAVEVRPDKDERKKHWALILKRRPK